MLKSAYEGLNARPKVYLSEEYFCEMYPTCVSSKLCEFILFKIIFLVFCIFNALVRPNLQRWTEFDLLII